MPSVRTEICIEASPEAVWAVLSDFSRYGEWNRLLLEVKGELSPGALLRIGIKVPFLPVAIPVHVKLRGVEPGLRFDWTGTLLSPGIFRGDHQFSVIPLSNDRTRFEHNETYSGILSWAVNPVLPLLRRLFRGMNNSLKAAAEASSREIQAEKSIRSQIDAPLSS